MLVARSFVAAVIVPVVVGFCVAVAGCDPEKVPPLPPPPAAQCELDLNVDTAGATAVTAGTAVDGILCPAFDQDYFAFDVDTAGTIVSISLSMATRITPLDPAYRIVKDNGAAEGEGTPFFAEDPDEANQQTDFTASHRIEVPGRYYVVVFDARAADDAFDVANPYTVTVELVTDPDQNEPNNDGDAASIVAIDGSVITGAVATIGDEDWYAIDVAAGARIVDALVTANVDSAVVHEAVLIAADGTSEVLGGLVDVVDEDDDAVVSRRLRSRVAGGARSYLVVRDRDGSRSDLSATGAYTVTIRVLDNPDVNEGATGNDDVTTATRVASGAELTASLASTADQDVYRIAPGTFSAAAPGVLIVEVEVAAVDVTVFRPQLTILGEDPERDAPGQACVAGCAACDQSVCKNARLQRFIRGPGFRTAYPLRSNKEVVVLLNEFGDDAFQLSSYTIRFEVIRDPDVGERGDDFLIANLEFAGFANGADLARQFEESTPRARPLTTTFPAVCTGEAGDSVGCLPIIAVPAPIDGIDPDLTTTVDCSAAGAGDQTVTASGRLSYDGDRDYFRVDVPDEGYWALDFRYSATGPANTPVELAMFVHAGNVIANTLEAEQTQGGCRDSSECPVNSICVDNGCWAESTTNDTFSNRVFPASDECSFVSVADRGNRPLILEVTDNGINDFDTNLAYSFQLTIKCGCPTACNIGGGLADRCQGVSAP